MDMEIARIAAFRRDRRHRIERLTAKKGDLYIFVEAVDAEEPVRRRLALSRRDIEGRVPFDRLSHPRTHLFDQPVQPRTGGRLPSRHRRDLALPRHVAIPFDTLRISARTTEHHRAGQEVISK